MLNVQEYGENVIGEIVQLKIVDVKLGSLHAFPMTEQIHSLHVKLSAQGIRGAY